MFHHPHPTRLDKQLVGFPLWHHFGVASDNRHPRDLRRVLHGKNDLLQILERQPLLDNEPVLK